MHPADLRCSRLSRGVLAARPPAPCLYGLLPVRPALVARRLAFAKKRKKIYSMG